MEALDFPAVIIACAAGGAGVLYFDLKDLSFSGHGTDGRGD